MTSISPWRPLSRLLQPNHSRITPSNFDSSNSLRFKSSHSKFPWIHSAIPPHRITLKDDYSKMPNNWRARWVRRYIAAKELNMTVWDVLPLPGGRVWEKELAGNCAAAFHMALAELLRHLYPRAAVLTDGSGLSFDSRTNTTPSLTTPPHPNKYLTDMVDSALLSHYQHPPAHLRLTIQPIESHLLHIFAIPMLTREICRSKPHLRGAYTRIEEEFQRSRSTARVREMTYALAEEIGEHSFRRTVVAEVWITCRESFWCGEGEEELEEEEVVHVVRFEVVTDVGEEGRVVGSWKIIDWDDLLVGNVFH